MPADIQHSRIKMRNGKNFAAVAGLEPATSARMRRFANLASRHTVPLSCAADFLRHYVQQCGVSSRHRREGVSAHPVNLSLCSPFLDIGAACPPPTLTTLHSIIATIVASVCSGWNHRPAVSLVCTTCQRTYLLSSLAEGAGFKPAVCGRYKSIIFRWDRDSCLRPLGQPSNFLNS